MENKWKRYIPLMVLGVLVLVFAGIYIVANRTGMPMKDTNVVGGFWLGLWQGIIVVLSFIASWFDKNIVLYQLSNNGFNYNLGYLFGLAISIGAGARSSKRKFRTKAKE